MLVAHAVDLRRLLSPAGTGIVWAAVKPAELLPRSVPPDGDIRHKLIQILGNLLSNARHALKDSTQERRLLIVRLRRCDASTAAIEVEDSGVGIPRDILARLFEFGFTTKKDGHGFGLHTSSILAKELAGELAAFSDGPGRGAKFVLKLPSAAEQGRKQA